MNTGRLPKLYSLKALTTNKRCKDVYTAERVYGVADTEDILLFAMTTEAIHKWLKENCLYLADGSKYETKNKEKEPANKEKSILQEAEEIIYGDREQTYGDPAKNLRTIGAFWSVYLGAKYDKPINLDVNDVCCMMVLLKQARLINSPEHRDSKTDTCGYTALMQRVQDYQKTQKEQKNSSLLPIGSLE